MANYTSKITYFEKPGKQNSMQVMELANLRAQELNIDTVLVASTTGYTARLAVDTLPDKNIIVVTHAAGYAEPDGQEFESDVRDYVQSKGGKVLTAQHTFAGVDRAIRQKLGGYQSDEIIAHVLRLFGQGMKVVFEIAMMAADAGFVSTQKPVLAIGGTHRGADLGVVQIPANSSNFFDLKMVEIFCMPSLNHPMMK